MNIYYFMDDRKRILDSVNNDGISIAGKPIFTHILERLQEIGDNTIVVSNGSDHAGRGRKINSKEYCIIDRNELICLLEKDYRRGEKWALILLGGVYTCFDDVSIDRIREITSKKKIHELNILQINSKDDIGLPIVKKDPSSRIIINEATERTLPFDIGCYVMDPVLFRKISFSSNDDVRGSIHKLIKEEQSVNMLIIDTYIKNIKDVHSIVEIQRFLFDNYKLDMDIITINTLNEIHNIVLNTPLYVSGDTTIGERCRIGPYATLMENTIIGDDVYIINSIILNDCTIENGCYIEGAIIGPGAHIEKGTELVWGEKAV